MATNLSEPPGQPPGTQTKERSLEDKPVNTTMDSTEEILKSSPEAKPSSTGGKRKTISNESEDEDKSESLDDICRKKFKPIAPKPFLKKDQHQSVVMTAMPVKEGSDFDKSASAVDAESPTKGAMIFMGPNMQLYPSAPFIVHPPPLVPCSGSVIPGGAFSFAMPAPVGHFVPHGYCPTGQYQTCCVRLPPPVIEGRDYYVNGIKPDDHSANKEDVSRKVESAKIVPKSQPTLSPCSKESSKSKASRYKYSILYNGPIYKGSTPTGSTVVSSTPQPNTPSTAPSLDNFVSTTESDNNGNVKVSLSAVLTSTGVLQITVPSLRSIDPKRTNNPSAFPQIKLQTIHGAALTPGVLPTVLSPQHHPTSGQVVVVSAHNQVSPSSQLSTSNQVSRHSHITVSNKPVPTRLNVSTTTSARTDLAISRTIAPATNVVTCISSNPRPVANTAVITSLPNGPEQSTALSDTTRSNNPEARTPSSDQSLRSILGGVNTTDAITSSSSMPTTTVPSLVNVSNVQNSLHRSADTVLSSRDSSHAPLRVSASIGETNQASQASNSIRSMHVDGNSHTPPGSVLNAVTAPDSRQHSNNNSSIRTPVDHSVNNQQNSENTGVPSHPNSAISHTSNRTHLLSNAAEPDMNVRWPSTTGSSTNSSSQNMPHPRNGEDNAMRLGSRIPGTDRSQVPVIAVTSSMAYTGSTSVSNPSSHMTQTRTGSLTQPVAIPRMSDSSGSSVGSEPPEQRQATLASSGHMNSQNSNTVPNNNTSGSNVGVANQRSGSSHLHQQRHVEKEPTSGTNVNSPLHVIDTTPAARRVMSQPDHATGSIQQVPNTNRNDSNAQRSNPVVTNSVPNRIGGNLPGDTIRTDSITSGMRSNLRDTSADGKRPSHSQQYPQMSGMPPTHQNMPSTGQIQQYPVRSQSTQSSQPPTDLPPQTYTSTSSIRGQEKPHGPPVVCITSRNEFVRPTSTHRWPVPATTSHSQVQPSTSVSPPSSQTSYTSPLQSASSNYTPNLTQSSSNSAQIRQLHPQERSASNTRAGFPLEDRTFETRQNLRFNAMQTGKNTTSRPWQNSNENSTSGMNTAYGGLGVRGRSLSASQLADSDTYSTMSHQHADRFGPIHTNEESDLHIQTVPLHSNVAANTRQAMNDVINRRASKTSRPQPRRSSELMQTPSDSSSGGSRSLTDPNLSTEQSSSNNRTNFSSSIISQERSQSDTGVPHSSGNRISHGGTSGGVIHSDSIHRLPMPIVHPMLYGNSPAVPNLGGLHGMPLPGGLGGHSVARHNASQHSLTPPPPAPPPSHQTPPRPASHMHNHMFVPPPYASMHRPLYMPAPSPRPPDIGLMSPRSYGHVHDSGLYSPRFQSMQSSSSLADSILSSHLARTFSDDRLDTCCSGMHAHSPPAPTNTRHILPPGFSSPAASSLGHPLHMPPSPSPTAATGFNSNPTGDTTVNRPLSLPPRSTPGGSLHQQQCPSSYQRPPQTAMPSDIFGASHLERVPPTPSMLSQSSSSTSSGMSNRVTCVSSVPSVPAPLTVQTNLNMSSNMQPSTNSSSSSSSNMHSESTSVNTPTGTSHTSPPTSVSSPMSSTNGNTPLPTRVFIGNTSDKYLPLEETPPPTSTSNGTPSGSTTPLNNDQVVKFGDVVLQCSRQILRESGRTVLCCWHCDYHTAEPKKMYRHQKKDTKSMKCQLCDFKGYSRCTINQHFKEKHMDKM